MPNTRTGDDYLDVQTRIQARKDKEKRQAKSKSKLVTLDKKSQKQGPLSKLQGTLQKLSDRYPAPDKKTRKDKDKRQGSQRLRGKV